MSAFLWRDLFPTRGVFGQPLGDGQEDGACHIQPLEFAKSVPLYSDPIWATPGPGSPGNIWGNTGWFSVGCEYARPGWDAGDQIPAVSEIVFNEGRHSPKI